MTVFISGASSGIGEACARAFAESGKDLILVARRKDRLEKLASELKKTHGVSISVFQLDVRSRKVVEAFCETHAKELAAVRVLINNAGLAAGLAPIQSGDVDDWDQMMDTNVKGLLYVTKGMLPHLIAQAKAGGLGSAHIINIGSVAGHWVYPNGNVYCASKYAVKALNEGMRVDLHGTGVRVTEIAPGMVETEFSEVRLKDKTKAKAVYTGMQPLSGKDIAEAVRWCVERPAHVNVQQLVVFPTAQSSVGLVQRG